jgi:hypothetical protein
LEVGENLAEEGKQEISKEKDQPERMVTLLRRVEAASAGGFFSSLGTQLQYVIFSLHSAALA